MQRFRVLAALAVLTLPALLCAPPPARTLDAPDAPAARFKDPPRGLRILQIIHNFPDDAAARGDLVRRLAARGFGGVTANVSFDDYLRSEAKWRSFEAGVEAARAAGLTVWLYDEQGYPSGSAGGLVLEGHPEWEARGLFCVVEESGGEKPIEVEVPEGAVVLAAAYPLRGGEGVLAEGVDLLSSLPADRKLRWDRPGPWRVCAIVEARLRENTHATENLYKKRPYPNLLEAGPDKRFIELTHEAYARRFPDLSARFEAVFTDEPSLLSVFIREAPRPALPWASGLAGAFRRAKGRDLAPLLPALAADFGPEGRRARCEFWDVVGREVAANYFGRIQDWCRAHGIASTGHLLAEEDLGSHVGFYGNFYACASRLDIPGMDCLTSDPATVPWHVAKLIGSIACVNGRPRAQSETSDHSQRYRPAGDKRPPRDVSEAEILGTLHLLHVAGINAVTSYYSWAGLDDGAVRRINEHVGRLGAVLAGARHACDLAVLYPLESAWARFTPRRLWASAPGVARVDGVYRDVLSVLFHARRDLDIVDSASIAAADVGCGALVLGGERYRVLALPASDVMPIEALRKAKDLVRGGGTVIAVGDVPQSTPECFPSADARGIAERVFGAGALAPDRDASRLVVHRDPSGGAGIYLPERNAWLLPSVLDAVLEPDLKAPEGSPLRYSRWRAAAKHAYLVINDSGEPCSAEVRTRGEGPAERWDPATGGIARLERAAGGGWPLALPPYGAAFLVFGGVREPRGLEAGREIAAAIEAKGLLDGARAPPRLELGTAPHVKASAAPLGGGGAPFPACIAARIETGGVDSWCFAELRFPEPIDFTGFRAIEVSTRVPPGQESSTARLLMILVEEGAGGSGAADYLADVRRPLNEAGLQRSAVPLDAFRLAGWSRDLDGRLDPARVRAVRIGWGGTTGRAGETIAFDLEGIALLRVKS